MKQVRGISLAVLAGATLAWIQPAIAEEETSQVMQESSDSAASAHTIAEAESIETPEIGLDSLNQSDLLTWDETAQDEAAQQAEQVQITQAAPIQVTGIRLNQAEQELEIILDTLDDTSLFIDANLFRTEGNALIADIPQAVLTLPDAESFSADDPTPDIAQIQVTQLDAETIQVTVRGRGGALPTTDVVLQSGGLAYVLNPGDLETQQELIITGEATDDDYSVSNASTATRTDTPIIDTPQAVQVIPRSVLDDQQILRVDEALQNVSGVVGTLAPFGSGGNLTLRGFSADTFTSGAILRDGYRINDNLGTQELANVERVEVIKGPSSVLYGQNDPGGLINLVRKQPLDELSVDVGLRAGSFGLVNPTIDVSSPLTEDGSVRARLNLSHFQEQGYRGFETDTNRLLVAPIVTWDISEQATLTALIEYVDEEGPADLGFPARGTGVFDLPVDTVNGDPNSLIDTETVTLGYDFQYRFNEDWTLNQGMRYVGQSYFTETALPFAVDADTGDVTLILADRRYRSDDYTIQANVVGEFDTGPVEHTLLAGADFNFNVFREPFTRLGLPPNRSPVTLNLFDPDYSVFPDNDLSGIDPFPPFDTNTDRYGFFLQDQLNIGQRFIVVGSLRYDIIDFRPALTAGTARHDARLSPRVGLIYKPMQTVSIYGNYSQSFKPNEGRAIDGSSFDPEEGEGFEFGVKAELLEGNVFATLAYFDITKQNVLVPIDFVFSETVGEQNSRGVEFDIAGEILPGWQIVANYAYVDARVTEDEVSPFTGTSNEGNRLFNSPYHSAGLWTTYEVQAGDFQGLGFGLGLNYVGNRAGNLANSFEIEDYFVTNLSLFYNQDRWRVGLNVKNLFNVDHIVSNTVNNVNFGNVPGQPLTVIGTVSVDF